MSRSDAGDSTDFVLKWSNDIVGYIYPVDGGNNYGWIFGERGSLNTLLASGFIRRR